MERTRSTGKMTTLFSGHKKEKDDGHLAADITSNDLNPLIRLVGTGIQEGLSSGEIKVLFRKQGPHSDFFLTTNFHTDQQSTAYQAESLRPSQYLDAVAMENQRAVYWMKKLPTAQVHAAGGEMIELCARAEFGLECTPYLRQKVQALHDAINTPLQTMDTPERKHSAGNKPGLFRSLQRSLTHTRSRSNSRDNSPEKSPRKLQSPRVVNFQEQPEVHFVPVSPRKPTSPSVTTTPTPTTSKPATPRLGREREVPDTAPSDTITPPHPPARPLPAPPTAESTQPAAETRSPRKPVVLTPFETNRAHPQPMLRVTPLASQPPSKQNTPADTPRKADEH